MALVRKTIIDGEKSRTETELIVNDFGGITNMTETATRRGGEILIKRYVFSCGEFSEKVMGTYTKRDSYYSVLDKQLRGAGF